MTPNFCRSLFTKYNYYLWAHGNAYSWLKTYLHLYTYLPSNLGNLSTHITIQYAWLNLFSSQNLCHTIYTYEASFSHEPLQCVFSFWISEKNTNHRGNIQKALCLHEPLKCVFSGSTCLWIHCYIFHKCILCPHQMIQHHAEKESISIFFLR